MPAVTIRPCSVADLCDAPNIGALLAEYGAECSIPGLGQVSPQFETYRIMEHVGLAQMFGAWHGADLIGFLIVIQNELPHYGQAVAVSESYFVASDHRKSGAGLALLKAASDHARETGAKGLFVSAPIGGKLAEVLPGLGFTETNRVFFKPMP